MSRIGNKPVQIPAGVEVAVNGNNVVVKGPKGQLELDVFEKLAINVEDNVLTVSRPDDERETRARHGLTRALIHNMVVGVSEGFEKKLELAGVGYRVQQKGKNLEFSLGFSHTITVTPPEAPRDRRGSRGHHLRGSRQHPRERQGYQQAAGRSDRR